MLNNPFIHQKAKMFLLALHEFQPGLIFTSKAGACPYGLTSLPNSQILDRTERLAGDKHLRIFACSSVTEKIYNIDIVK